MKVCPRCNAKYDYDMSFCLEDGTPLQILDVPPAEESDDKTLIMPAGSTVSQPTVPHVPSGETQPTNPQLVSPTAQSPANRQPPPPAQSAAVATRKPHAGLAVAISIAALALIGVAAGGAWWYLRNREDSNLALVNSNKNREEVPSNSNSNFNPSNNFNTNLPNLNSAGNFNNSSDISGNSNLKPFSNNNVKPSPTSAATAKPTTTPENKPTPQIETPTPVKPTPTPEIETPTPTPVRTPVQRPDVQKVVPMGVVNGRATRLVTPQYPPAARAIRASGTVNVRVLIDEDGNVMAANAVNGHPLLRQSAESAARASKFAPTLLSGQPVKVRGIIVYNFVAN